MTTIGFSTRVNAQRMRPLAIALAGLCAASASLADAAVSPFDTPAIHDIAARFGTTILSPPPSHTLAVVSNCDDAGPGSLRDTVIGAADGDTVDLTQLTCSHITLSTGAIVFGQSNLAIQGPGVNDLTIDGGLGGAVLYHLGGGTLIVNDLTIAYGFKYRSDVSVLGSCIHSEGNVLTSNVHISTCNTVSTGPYAALGGAIWAGGAVQLENSIITASEAHATGFGYASGGGVYANNGFVSVYSTVAYNVALGESATPSFGGGVFARGGVLTLGSTFSGNQAARMGGLALADNNGTAATLVNSTVSNNHATLIGGVYARAALNVYNSTIAFNTSHQWTDGTSYFGAGVHVHVGGEMDSSILANNVNDAAPFPTTDLTGDPGSGFLGGHNNIMFCGAPCPVDTSHDDPGLHPLADNGGLTRTHVPTPGIWDTFGGTNLLGLQWDQRGPGFPRLSTGDFPEIGAIQLNSDIIFANGFN